MCGVMWRTEALVFLGNLKSASVIVSLFNTSSRISSSECSGRKSRSRLEACLPLWRRNEMNSGFQNIQWRRRLWNKSSTLSLFKALSDSLFNYLIVISEFAPLTPSTPPTFLCAVRSPYALPSPASKLKWTLIPTVFRLSWSSYLLCEFLLSILYEPALP